jgi:hypothetical protein
MEKKKHLGWIVTLSNITEAIKNGMIKDSIELYVVGKVLKNTKDGRLWEFQGIFTSKILAESACIEENFFIGPVKLDSRIPMKSIPWSGAYYPKHKKLPVPRVSRDGV